MRLDLSCADDETLNRSQDSHGSRGRHSRRRFKRLNARKAKKETMAVQVNIMNVVK